MFLKVTGSELCELSAPRNSLIYSANPRTKPRTEPRVVGVNFILVVDFDDDDAGSQPLGYIRLLEGGLSS